MDALIAVAVDAPGEVGNPRQRPGETVRLRVGVPLAPIMELVDMPASEVGADLALQVRVLLGASFRPTSGRKERTLDEFCVDDVQFIH